MSTVNEEINELLNQYSFIKNMDLRNQVLKEHTKANCQKIVDWVDNDSSRFNDLFLVFLNDEYRLTQRPHGQ